MSLNRHAALESLRHNLAFTAVKSTTGGFQRHNRNCGRRPGGAAAACRGGRYDKSWPPARRFAPGGGGDNVTELCYGAVGAGGPTANAYLPGTGTYDRGGNTPVASGPETKGKTPRPSNKGSGPKHLMTGRAPNTSRPTHERSEGTPEDSGPKHLLTGKPLIKGGGTFRERSGNPSQKVHDKGKVGPQTPIYRVPNTYTPRGNIPGTDRNPWEMGGNKERKRLGQTCG